MIIKNKALHKAAIQLKRHKEYNDHLNRYYTTKFKFRCITSNHFRLINDKLNIYLDYFLTSGKYKLFCNDNGLLSSGTCEPKDLIYRISFNPLELKFLQKNKPRKHKRSRRSKGKTDEETSFCFEF